MGPLLVGIGALAGGGLVAYLLARPAPPSPAPAPVATASSIPDPKPPDPTAPIVIVDAAIPVMAPRDADAPRETAYDELVAIRFAGAPAGTQVLQDGVAIGSAPLIKLTKSLYPTKLVLRATGYLDRAIEVTPGRDQVISGRLTAKPRL